MSTYRKIHGRSIQAVTTDPSESVAEGQVWYNTTSDTFKTVLVGEATSSQASLTTARGHGSAAGTTTAAIVAFGDTNPVPGSAISPTETWNGSGFSSSPNVNTARKHTTGFGTATSALFAGGPGGAANVETYDGSSFSETTDLNTGRANLGASSNSPQTAGLVFGGEGPPATGATELWNGSSWSEQPDLNTARTDGAGAGISTSALYFGGEPTPANGNKSEEYNGSTWAATPNLNTNQQGNAGAGANADSALSFGGPPPAPGTQIETFDGTSWTTSPATLATARYNIAGCGTTSSTLAAGGFRASPAAFITTTEQYDKSANVITAAAFSSGGNMASPKQDGAGFGIQTAAIGAGGYVSGYTNNAQSYNGTSWTAIPNINTTRSCRGLGTQASGLICAGNTPGDTPSAATESWNGSSWTSVNSMNTARASVFSIGTYTSGLIAGGSPTSATETWDGTNWTSNPSNINTTRRGGMSAGTVSAGLICAGDPLGGSPNPEVSNATEEWDGSSWTSGNNSITERNGARGFGIQTSAVITTGANQGGSVYYATSEIYNGTNWATNPSLANARGNTQPSGVGSPIASSGVIFGGFTGSYFDSTEHFTGETSAVNVKTLTQS